jgi:Fe-S cluster biosynthesis and repair protein YggX
MAQVKCSKCGRTADGLAESPFNNALGKKVLEQVCQSCWNEWIRQQLMLMNEYRLNPLDPQHSDFLDEQMKVFLSLR